MIDLQFRKGNEQDRQALSQLLQDNQMDPDVDPVEFTLAISAGQLAGATRLEIEEGLFYLRPVVVASEFQGKGVGRALVNELAKDFPVLHVAARGSAVEFYRRLGFEPIDWEQVPQLYRDECGLCPDKPECCPVPMRLTNFRAEDEQPDAIPVVTVIGRSGSGKTTLLEKVIRELTGRGHRLAAVKHHSHSNFDVDVPGKDSWRFFQAGSQHVVISAPEKLASYHKLQQEVSLDEIIQGINGVDLILVEGYKKANKPTIEVIRSAVSSELIGDPQRTIAIVSDIQRETQVPFYYLDDYMGVADFIEKSFLQKRL